MGHINQNIIGINKKNWIKGINQVLLLLTLNKNSYE